MTRHSVALGTACLTGVALLVLTASVANAQDDSGRARLTDKKKAETRKVDVLVNVSSKDDKPLPAGLRVEISGQESVCGSLNSNDAKAPVDDKGKAMFRDLPGCKVTVKINSNQYLPVRKAVDLAGYRSCAAAAPKEHGEDGPPQAPCEPILLVLDPLT